MHYTYNKKKQNKKTQTTTLCEALSKHRGSGALRQVTNPFCILVSPPAMEIAIHNLLPHKSFTDRRFTWETENVLGKEGGPFYKGACVFIHSTNTYYIEAFYTAGAWAVLGTGQWEETLNSIWAKWGARQNVFWPGLYGLVPDSQGDGLWFKSNYGFSEKHPHDLMVALV